MAPERMGAHYKGRSQLGKGAGFMQYVSEVR